VDVLDAVGALDVLDVLNVYCVNDGDVLYVRDYVDFSVYFYFYYLN